MTSLGAIGIRRNNPPPVLVELLLVRLSMQGWNMASLARMQTNGPNEWHHDFED